MPYSNSRLSQIFLDLASECEDDHITFKDLLRNLGSRGHAFVVLLCSIPFLTPIPIPGLSIILGGFILAAGVGIAIDKPYGLPEFIATRELPALLFKKIFLFFAAILKRCEHFISPRFENYVDSAVVKGISGTMIAISGFLLALPLPPGTNFPPALVCTFLSIGLLEKDGAVLSIGFVLFIIKVIVIIGLYFYLYSYFASFF
jgi:hypothetical protein